MSTELIYFDFNFKNNYHFIAEIINLINIINLDHH